MMLGPLYDIGFAAGAKINYKRIEQLEAETEDMRAVVDAAVLDVHAARALPHEWEKKFDKAQQHCEQTAVELEIAVNRWLASQAERGETGNGA